MMVADATLPDSLQALVDARLDTIDRMLLGRVPRADRTAITREVEAQIHDLLAERAGGEVDRDLVLSALARLDPPEAYLPDEATGETHVVRRPLPPRPVASARARPSSLCRAGGIVGLTALGLDLVAAVSVALAFLAENEFFLFVFLGLASAAFTVGIVALALSIYARVATNWAVIGLTTGLIAAVASPAAMAVVFFLFL